MENRRSTHFKNILAVTALILSLAALQSPLWRPDAPLQSLTAQAGGTIILTYDHPIERATIFKKRTATISSDGPGRLMIHGHEPGKANLLIRYKDGNSSLYEVTVPPG